MMIPRRLQRLFPIVAAIAASALCLVLAMNTAANQPRRALWGEWTTVLVEASIPAANVVKELDPQAASDPAGKGVVLYRGTQPVFLADWSGTLREFSLAEVVDGFVPGDPRVDEYVRGLESWFRAQGPDGRFWNLYYLPPSHPLADPSGAEKALVPFGTQAFVAAPEVRYPQVFALQAGLCAIAVAMFATGSFRRYRGTPYADSAKLAAVSSAPFLLLAAGGTEAAVMGILLAIAFSGAAARRSHGALNAQRIRGFLGAENARAETRVAGIAADIANPLLAAVALAATPSSAVAGIVASLAAALALLSFDTRYSAPAGTEQSAEKEIRHRPFRVTSIAAAGSRGGAVANGGMGDWKGDSRKAKSKTRDPGLLALRLAAPIALCALLVPAFVSVFAPFPRDGSLSGGEAAIPIPAPSRGTDSGTTMGAAHIAHRAFEESLAFERMGGIPSNPFADAVLDYPDGKVTVKRFDAAWFAEATVGHPSLSVESMLAALSGSGYDDVDFSGATLIPPEAGAIAEVWTKNASAAKPGYAVFALAAASLIYSFVAFGRKKKLSLPDEPVSFHLPGE